MPTIACYCFTSEGYFEISVPPFLGVSFMNATSSGMGRVAMHVPKKENQSMKKTNIENIVLRDFL